MSRRGLTLLLAALLAVGLTAVGSVARVPYVALGPGPTFNTLGQDEGDPVLDISGRRTYPTDGHLDLTTVNVQSELTLAEALRGWFERDRAVVPRNVVYPDDQTKEEVDEQNAAEMTRSQDDAVLAAARTLGLRVATVTVSGLSEGSPAAGKIRPGDVLVSVDGAPVRDAADVVERVSSRPAGDPVEIGVRREGVERTVTVVTGSRDTEDGPRTVIGVETSSTPVAVPFQVKIGLKDVGGPSAGLMFTLGILDKLDEPSLTGGKFVAGTGEIRSDGTVGPIGGIQLKLIAADRKGAVAFLVPQGNCDEALRRHPPGLPLIAVTNVKDALDGLQAVRRGTEPRLCEAGRAG